MAYAYSGAGAPDYFPCRYGNSRLTFRGPKRETEGAGGFIAALGGTETYGRFVPAPWPELLETAADCVVANFGHPNAGPDTWLAERGVLALAARARLRVLQIPGAINLSNRFYKVHSRRNDRFIGASSELRALYPDVDFTEFNYTRHLINALALAGDERFALVTAELRGLWRLRMQELLREVGMPTVLLWLAEAPPPRAGEATAGLLSPGMPALVDDAMLRGLRARASPGPLVQVVVPDWGASTSGKVFAPLDLPAALSVPGPDAHEAVARALAPLVDDLASAAPA